MTNVEVWLWILLVMLPHNPRMPALLSRYRTALDAAIAMRDGECDLLTPDEKQRVERTRTREVKALIAQCERLGIRIITLDNPEYPSQLRRIDNPPIVLFVKGDLSALGRMPAVAVVGPRSHSEYGGRVTDMLCGELVRDGVAIVSGLAVGIDGAAHSSAIRHKGYTVGVLGCGPEVDYPPENAALKKEILERGGALVSELLPYSSANALYFRMRNRIIAGMSVAAAVIEAGAKSGSLVTAAITRDQGKPVFCVPPHDIYDGALRGGIQLLRDYALPLYGATDIYDELLRRAENGEHIPHTELLRATADAEPPAAAATPQQKKKSEKKSVPKTEEIAEFTEIDLTDFSPEEGQVISLLKEKPLTMDEIIDKSGKRHDEICSIILGLELMDAVERRQDGTFILR